MRKTKKVTDKEIKSGIFATFVRFLTPDSNQLVFVVAAIVIVGGFALSKFAGDEKLSADVRFADKSPIEDFKKSRTQLNSDAVRLGETDPNLRLAERTREASAMAIGLGWFVLNERVSEPPRVTAEVTELMDNFSRSPLLPPDCRVLSLTGKTDYGLIQTVRGIYYVRYRARPLLIEILASGRDQTIDGAVFVLRLPDHQAADYFASQPNSANIKIAGSWASIYIAPENKNAFIPPPFASGTVYLNTGWKPELLRAGEFGSDKINELQKFLTVAK